MTAMGKLVVFVIAFGLLIGLALPSGKRATAAATTNAAGEKEVVLTRGSTGHFFTDAKVNDHGPVEFIVDTGASIVALSMADARALGVEVDPSNFTVVGEGAGGPVRGQEVYLASVDVGGIKVEHVKAVVLEGSNMSLLGQTFLTHVDHVDMSGDYLSLRDAG